MRRYPGQPGDGESPCIVRTHEAGTCLRLVAGNRLTEGTLLDTIPYIGAQSAVQSPMGLIIPLALAVSILLLMTVWKPAKNSTDTMLKGFLQGSVIGAAVVWSILWSSGAGAYNDDSDAAAEQAALNLGAAYGLEIDQETALAIVQDNLEGREFEGITEAGVILMSASWDDGELHLYSRGYEAAALSQAGTER